MKLNFVIKSLALGASLAATSAFALPNYAVIQSTAFNGGNPTQGEFKASLYTGSGHLIESFNTFCLEENVKVGRNVKYSYTIDANALNGGVIVSHPGDSGPGDPISQGTAYLYYMFVRGMLKDSLNPSASYWDANHNYNAGVLQQAIWILEDETSNPGNNYYVNLVQSIFLGHAQDAYTGTSVRALNLWDSRTGKDVQSQLFFVPDGNVTAILVGLGLLEVGFVRRRA